MTASSPALQPWRACRAAGLSPVVILALGFANLAADGLSMGVGNYLGIKSERATELQDKYDERHETQHAARHGMEMLLVGALAGVAAFLAGWGVESIVSRIEPVRAPARLFSAGNK